MSDNGIKLPPYTPIESLGHELGIMFGFLAACIGTVGLYFVIWQVTQRRAAERDEARRKDLRARGFHHERGGYHEKILDRYASRDPAARTQGQTLEFLTEPSQLGVNSRSTTAETTETTSSGLRNPSRMSRGAAGEGPGGGSFTSGTTPTNLSGEATPSTLRDESDLI